MGMTYPKAPTTNRVEHWFGHDLDDPYATLSEPTDSEVLAWVAAENALTDEWFSGLGVDELASRLRSDELPRMITTISRWRDGYVATRPDGAGVGRCIILDSKFHEVGILEGLPEIEAMHVEQAAPCPLDHDLLAVFGEQPGDARATCYLWDSVGERVVYSCADVLSMTWSVLDGCLYLAQTTSDSDTQESHTRYLRYDPRSSEEKVAFDVEDPRAIFGVLFSSSDGCHVIMQTCLDYSHATWHALDVADGSVSRLSAEPVEWNYVDTLNGAHLFVSMSDANNGLVLGVRDDGAREIVLPESDELVLASGLDECVGFTLAGELYLVVRRDVSRAILKVSDGSFVSLASRHANVGVIGRDESSAYLAYASFTEPPQLLVFDGMEARRVLMVRDVSHDDVVVEQIFAESADGTRVPYYLVRRRDTVPDGTHWALMYAYGGYNNDMPPWYTERTTGINVAEWVEAGNVYIHANIRGGSEYGPRWHEDGMGLTKRHCYEDYIGVAEHASAIGWTSPGRIVITGASNGGLLNSVLVTMRPDLWGCVIDSVPHTDMIHFANDARGPMYVTEYGNPRESKEMFEYLLSYSPYHNVRAERYPATYIQTGECDNNVPPYHGKKFAARMQEMTVGEAPVLLRVLARGGHNRGGNPDEYWRTTTEMRTFIMRAMGQI